MLQLNATARASAPLKSAPPSMELRDYQSAAVDSLFRCWQQKDGTRHLIVASVGSGKTILCAAIVRRAYAEGWGKRALILTHIQELVRQNYITLKRFWPRSPAGVYSASLGRKDRAAITVGSVQTVVNSVDDFGHIDLIVIDEAHLISPTSDTSYQKVFDALRAVNPNLRIVGLTGTSYRLNSGSLVESWKGTPPLFDTVAAEITELDMLERGMLCAPITKAGKRKVDLTGVRTTMGEYNSADLEKKFNTAEVNTKIVDEICDLAADRKSWLVFSISIDHSERLADLFRERGIDARVVHAGTPKDVRNRIIEQFKAGSIRCVVNTGILTTGFDFPALDMIAIVRSTKSPGLFLQMLGRVVRNSPGKVNGLVLDYGNNTLLHGVFGEIRGVFKRTKDEPSLAKECPECSTIVSQGVRVCPSCGASLISGGTPEKPDREAKLVATNGAARVSVQIDDLKWLDAKSAKFFRTQKPGKPAVLRLTYETEVGTVSEVLCFDHRLEDGTPEWAAKKADQVWRSRARTLPPKSVDEAIQRINELPPPKTLCAKKSDTGYWNVIRTKN